MLISVIGIGITGEIVHNRQEEVAESLTEEEEFLKELEEEFKLDEKLEDKYREHPKVYEYDLKRKKGLEEVVIQGMTLENESDGYDKYYNCKLHLYSDGFIGFEVMKPNNILDIGCYEVEELNIVDNLGYSDKEYYDKYFKENGVKDVDIEFKLKNREDTFSFENVTYKDLETWNTNVIQPILDGIGYKEFFNKKRR